MTAIISLDPEAQVRLRSPAMGDLVSLYRCRHCGTRMFEERTSAHLQTHGIYGNGSTLSHFERGPRDTSPRPGDQSLTYGRARPAGGGRRKGQVATVPNDDGLEISEEEPISSLSEIVES
jgi:hypothetical protein